jgi:hypothetical protein
MCVWVNVAYVRMYIHMYVIHTYVHSYIYVYMYVLMHTYMNLHACDKTCMHTMHTDNQSYMRKHVSCTYVCFCRVDFLNQNGMMT